MNNQYENELEPQPSEMKKRLAWSIIFASVGLALQLGAADPLLGEQSSEFINTLVVFPSIANLIAKILFNSVGYLTAGVDQEKLNNVTENLKRALPSLVTSGIVDVLAVWLLSSMQAS
ncbi:MAG: hypothetical protein WAU07_00200 [Microgenomates group bacterium]